MKKFYLLTKTLLVAVLLCVGASNAWAQVSTWTYSTTLGNNTIGSAFSGNTNGVVSVVLGTSGQASNWAIANNNGNRGLYNNVDLVTYDGTSTNVPISGTFMAVTPVKDVNFSVGCYATANNWLYLVNGSTNVKTSLNGGSRWSSARTIDAGKLSAGVTYYFYSSESYDKKFAFRQFTATSYENYTIHYKDENGTTIKDDVVHEGLYGASVSATGSDLDPIFYDEKSYAYSSGNTSITLSSGSNEITLVYAVAGEHAYTINAMDGSTKIQELASGTAVESEIYNISNLPIVIEKGGKYYKLSDEDVSGYAKSFTMGTTDREDAVEYTLDESIVYYSELEDVENTTETASAGYSNGKYAYVIAENFPSITTLPHGKYSYEFYLKSNGNRGLYLRNIDKDKSENTIAHPSIDKSSVAGKYSADFTLFDDTNLGLTGYVNDRDKYNQSAEVDYVIIYKTDDVDDDVAAAIVDCETYETSAAFKSYIEGKYNSGDIATAADAYAAHTAWQVAQAKASHSTDYSKVILNHAVTSTDKYWGTLSDGESTPYTGAPDNFYLYNTEGADYNVNQTVYGLPAGRYTATVYTYSGGTSGYRKMYISNTATSPWTDLVVAENTDGTGWTQLNESFDVSASMNVAFGLYASDVAGRTPGFDNWTLTLTGEQVTVSDAGYATYVSSYDLDFTSTSIKAHTAVVNTSTGVVTLNPINKVPAGTPVVLYKEGGLTEVIPLAASTDAVGTNDLVAGTGAAVATGDDPYNYVLDNVSGIGFYKANGVTVATNRAYLQTTYNVADSSSARGMRMVFAGDITGINEAEATAEAAQKDGKFIENGKLVIVKNGKKYNANGTEIK